MKIIINEQQSNKMVKIIEKIVSSMDFDGGVKDFTVTIPNEEFPFPMYDVYLILDSEWISDNKEKSNWYLSRVKTDVRDRIKKLTGLDVYVGSFVK
jgi:hypothetical protein